MSHFSIKEKYSRASNDLHSEGNVFALNTYVKGSPPYVPESLVSVFFELLLVFIDLFVFTLSTGPISSVFRDPSALQSFLPLLYIELWFSTP